MDVAKVKILIQVKNISDFFISSVELTQVRLSKNSKI